MTLELKNDNEKYQKSRKISKNLENLEKTLKISKRKTHRLMAGETADRNTKQKIGVNWLSVKKDQNSKARA